MSRLREFKLKHQGMSLTEKEMCNCELCKGCNVDKTKRPIPSDKKIVNIEQKIPESFQVETSKVEIPKTPEMTYVETPKFPDTTSVTSSVELPRKRIIKRIHLNDTTPTSEGLNDIKI